MKKRLTAGLLAGVMAMSLMAGCGSSSTASTDTATASGSTATEAAGKDSYNMTLIMSQRDQFLSTLEEAAMDAAAKLNVNLTTQDAQNDASKQLQYIETSANNNEDAVLVNIVDSETGKECIEAAGDMACVFVNRSLSDNNILKDYPNAAVVASNEDTVGPYQVEVLTDYFKEQGKDTVKYILISGTLGHFSATHRTSSAKEAMETSGLTWEQVGEDLAGEFDRATAIDVISPLIGVEDFDCIICNNDEMAIGAAEALKAKGIDPATIPITGVDATTDGCEAVKDGTLIMSVFQNPVGQGSGAIQAAVNIINGKPVNEGTDFELAEDNEQVVYVPFEPVTADNVDDYM